MLEVAIDRDSVHAGDDMHSHETSINVEATATLSLLLDKVQTMGYLPGIRGGEATWIICTSEKPIGVLAQQWSEPKLTVPADSMVGEYFAGIEPRFLFRYWCQKNPDQVFDHIKVGNEPPPVY
ncbi:hypothetical protein ACQ4OB_03265 [Pseudomonas sp. ES4]|jgi:hypothetical protein|uniref:hypothetical protein n=1 Tax=Pseudomonas sp. ES4 TaxID=3424777 RepID=UPI003D32AE2A